MTIARFVSTVLCMLLFCPVYATAQQGAMSKSLDSMQVKGSNKYRVAVETYLQRKEPKIIGGQLAAKNAYPWQASLGVSWIDDPYRAHFCGATIFSDRWLITAAHCLVDTEPTNVVVSVGTNVLGVGGMKHTVSRIIVKSNYAPQKDHDNDIALIELFNPLKFGPSVKAIPIVTAKDEGQLMKQGNRAVVIGWGATKEGDKPVRDLRMVDVPFESREICNAELAYRGRLTTNMICAGEYTGGKDSCQGDSGGPLTVNTASDPRLAGIVSWGEGCARPNLLGVYTRVPLYETWISSCIAKPDSCN